MANAVVKNWYAGFTVTNSGNYLETLDSDYLSCEFMVNSVSFEQDASGCTRGEV